MLGGRDEEKVNLVCPQCGTKFQSTAKQAAKGKATCPRGHVFAVMGMLGGGGGIGSPM